MARGMPLANPPMAHAPAMELPMMQHRVLRTSRGYPIKHAVTPATLPETWAGRPPPIRALNEEKKHEHVRTSLTSPHATADLPPPCICNDRRNVMPTCRRVRSTSIGTDSSIVVAPVAAPVRAWLAPL